MLVSSQNQVAGNAGYDVIDPDINFSDHLPLFASFVSHNYAATDTPRTQSVINTPQLRWDRADLLSFYEFTRCNLEPILQSVSCITQQLDNHVSVDYCHFIDRVHDDIINVLNVGANNYVPHHRKNFYKFWWDQDMDILKAASIESNLAWKAAGKPRHGPIFDKRQASRLQY